MPALTRRRDPKATLEHWIIQYGDVRVGSIGLREGNPTHTDQWQWRCGFYPGSEPGECTSGTAGTFEDARVAFASAWPTFLAMRTEADFEEWRRHQVWTAEKYRRFERGERMRHDWKPW